MPSFLICKIAYIIAAPVSPNNEAPIPSPIERFIPNVVYFLLCSVIIIFMSLIFSSS